MKIFISWSKPLSHCVADKLQNWLCMIFPQVKIFISSEDIKTGARWNTEISKELESSNFGILVLTKENVNAPWIHFEAGALSKVIDGSRVCPLLVNIGNKDIPGPLAQFMSAEITQEGIKHLLQSINDAMEPSFQNSKDWVERVFKVWWPVLEKDVKQCREKHDKDGETIVEPSPTERMLEQVLQYVRLLSQKIEDSVTSKSESSEENLKDRDGCKLLVKSVLDDSESLIENYRKELPILHSFNQAGITALYKNRRLGVSSFAEAIRKAKEDLYIIGSSLKGLILEKEYEDISELILKKSREKGLQLRFLLTHPCVADLRARQEKRNRTEIGKEVITTLKKLQSWDISEKCIKLYMGTPTCFGIKADDSMLLNPYPYGGVSYSSPCLIVQRKIDATGFFFDAFNTSHFGVWESQVAVPIDSYKKTIEQLESALPRYSELIDSLLSDN